jgi:hypothetical protein
LKRRRKRRLSGVLDASHGKGSQKKIRAKCWLLSPSKLPLLFEFRKEIEKMVWKVLKQVSNKQF